MVDYSQVYIQVQGHWSRTLMHGSSIGDYVTTLIISVKYPILCWYLWPNLARCMSMEACIRQVEI